MPSMAGSKGGISSTIKEQLKEIRKRELTLEKVLDIGKKINQWEGSELEVLHLLGWTGVYGPSFNKEKRKRFNLDGVTGELTLSLTLEEPYLKEYRSGAYSCSACGYRLGTSNFFSLDIRGSAHLFLFDKGLTIFNETFTSPEGYLRANSGINERLLSSPYGQIHSFVKDALKNLKKS